MIKSLKSFVFTSLLVVGWLWLFAAYLNPLLGQPFPIDFTNLGKTIGLFLIGLNLILFNPTLQPELILLLLVLIGFTVFSHFGADLPAYLPWFWFGSFFVGAAACLYAWSETKKNQKDICILSLDQGLIDQTSDTHTRFQTLAAHNLPLTVLIPTLLPASKRRPAAYRLILCGGSNRYLAYLNLFFRLWFVPATLIVTNTPELGLLTLLPVKCRNLKLQTSIFGYNPKRFSWPLVRWSLRFADSIRVDTHQNKSDLMKATGLPASKFIVIPVVPSEAMQQIFIAGKRRTAQKTKLVLSVGTLTPNKAYDNFIAAAKIVVKSYPAVKFLIIGNGVLAKALKTSALGYPIEFQPPVDYAALSGFYHRADLYVCSSKQEGLPRVLMEAALSRCPIVTTAIAGAAAIIKNERMGTIVPRGNPAALAQAILWHLHHPSQSQKMAAAAHNHAINYLNYNHNMTRLLQSWQELL